MRTRRSPCNQEILWRALGGKKEKPRPVDKVALAEKALALPFLSPRMRRMYERDLKSVPRNPDEEMTMTTKMTCWICGNPGGHTSAQHYSTLTEAERPRAVTKAMNRVEETSGIRPMLSTVMEEFGVPKRPAV